MCKKFLFGKQHAAAPNDFKNTWEVEKSTMRHQMTNDSDSVFVTVLSAFVSHKFRHTVFQIVSVVSAENVPPLVRGKLFTLFSHLFYQTTLVCYSSYKLKINKWVPFSSPDLAILEAIYQL